MVNEATADSQQSIAGAAVGAARRDDLLRHLHERELHGRAVHAGVCRTIELGHDAGLHAGKGCVVVLHVAAVPGSSTRAQGQ